MMVNAMSHFLILLKLFIWGIAHFSANLRLLLLQKHSTSQRWIVSFERASDWQQWFRRPLFWVGLTLTRWLAEPLSSINTHRLRNKIVHCWNSSAKFQVTFCQPGFVYCCVWPNTPAFGRMQEPVEPFSFSPTGKTRLLVGAGET
jgi:hypothetical protein